MDYISKYCRSDVEFANLFGTENFLAKISTELSKAQILAKGPIEEPKLGYVYHKKRKTNKNSFECLTNILF